jgi:GR25 family glycosyltransferase involved in LPS biosynthesis
MSYFEIYMISMEHHPISEMYKREVLPSWKEYKVNQFNAVTPKDLYKKTKLDFGLKTAGKTREFTSTEIAVWYSHFELWCKCLSKHKPILIIEHDSKLVKPLPDMSKEGYKFLSFINRDFGDTGLHIAPGSGYYITPQAAERLIASAVSKPINKNSDGHIGTIFNFYKQVKMDDYHYIEQINIDGLNTIDHKNPHRKFIGQDYENIDLSSIHRKAV